jgi:2,5-furandicarboxylate decarboxylase 1
MAGNHLHDLALILDDLERHGRLARVRAEVDLKHDLAGIAASLEGGPRAVLFERVKGHRWPVFTGLYWNRTLLADLMRKDERTLPQFVSGAIKKWQRDPVDPVVVPSGPVKDVTERAVDLSQIPIPVHALKDGGPYFDAGVVIARDPETGVRNASIQRFQVVNRDTLHVNIDAGRHLEVYLEKARKKRQSLWLTLNCGVGPGLHFAAAAPAEAAPIDRDELGIASEFHEAPLELVAGTLSPVEMVAHAMWALECEMIPGEKANEGPFAEVTNYYAKVEPRPVVHVRRVHRRAAPVFQTILSGMEVWNSVGLLGEANVLALLQQQVPGVRDVYFSHGGCGFYHALVQVQQKRAGWAKQAIFAAFAAFPPLKMVTVVDDDVDIRSAQDVEWALATRLDPRHGIVTVDKAFGHGLNPSFPDYLGPKVGFDATKPYPPRAEYERASYKAVALDGLDIALPEIKAPERPGTKPAFTVGPDGKRHWAPMKVPKADPALLGLVAAVRPAASDAALVADAPATSGGRKWPDLAVPRADLSLLGADAPRAAAVYRAEPEDMDEPTGDRWGTLAVPKADAALLAGAMIAAPPAADTARDLAEPADDDDGAPGRWAAVSVPKADLAALERGPDFAPSASAPPARPPRPAAMPPVVRTTETPSPRPKPAPAVAGDDEDGGFFRGGAM